MRYSHHYALRVGHKNVKGDAILPLLPGAPLMITQNIDPALGESPLNKTNLLMEYRSSERCDCRVPWFGRSRSNRQCPLSTASIYVGQTVA